ncbi:MAG TPA: tetratricopeptide repeat protein, partial [Verrucomicrobiae bacterium]|nr:tetratricopeptide repeat protein [Verrucomicrobiae bacterium]
AAVLFSQAQELNSNNVVAQINLDFNKSLRAGSPAGVSLSRVTTDLFGKYHDWNDVMDANGPFDETSFCFEDGTFLVQNGLMRQAAAAFERVRQLDTNNLNTRLFLGQIYLAEHLPDRAMDALHDALTRPERFGLNETNSTELHVLEATCYFQKNENTAGAAVLESEMARHPNDETLMLTSAQVFNRLGLYTNALHAINRKLARTPDDPIWVYGKGIVCLKIGDYKGAVENLSHYLEMRTNNPDALYNRGVAYFQSGRTNGARADFLQVQAAQTNNLQVAYALGDIAWQQHETNEAIRNLKILVAYAPTNTPELKTIQERLAQLGGK